MKKSLRPSVWPNASQLLLLKASILPAKEAALAWRVYAEKYYDNPDPSSTDILSLAYYNLSINHGFKDYLRFNELKNSYYTVYARNKFLLNGVQPVLSALIENKIPIIAIKGFAYLFLYYKSIAARKTVDIDILIPPVHFYQAALILQKLGWKTFPCRSLETYNPKREHALTHANDAGNCIDLHYHVLCMHLNEGDDDDFLEGAVSFDYKDNTLLTLNHTDHLIHSCFHGSLTVPDGASLRWIIDAHYILENSDIDWDRFIFLTEKKELSLFMVNALKYLKAHFFAKIPDTVITKLQAIKTSRFDRKYYKITHQRNNSLMARLYFGFYTLRRNNRDKTFIYCADAYRRYIWAKLLSMLFKKISRTLRIST